MSAQCTTFEDEEYSLCPLQQYNLPLFFGHFLLLTPLLQLLSLSFLVPPGKGRPQLLKLRSHGDVTICTFRVAPSICFPEKVILQSEFGKVLLNNNIFKAEATFITNRMGQRPCRWNVTDLALGLDGMFHVASVKDGFPSQICKRAIMAVNSHQYRGRRRADLEFPF